MTDELPPPAPDGATSFGSVAEAYDRGRPTYPRAAAAWLTGPEPLTVLELGAGTGKLTAELVALGHDVHAVDPDPRMLAVLERRLPGVRTSVAVAEQIPLVDRSVDVVVAAQALHWFDLDRALPEIARVLKPGGRIGVVWNERDERIPWVRRLGDLIGDRPQDRPRDKPRGPAEPLVLSELFGYVESESFRFRQTIDRSSVLDLVGSRSHILALDDEARAAKLAQVLAFYDDYGRGMDGMQLPYAATCFRATVVARTQPSSPTARPGNGPGAGAEPDLADEDGDHRGEPEPPASDGSDTDMLLIDFR